MLFGDACNVLYVVVIGVSVGALALKKLARTFLLSFHDVFAELVAACNSHRLLLLPVSHSPGKHYMAYLVENGFRQISRNEHLFAESVSLHQFLYLPSSHQVEGLLLTRFTLVLASIFREVSRRCPSVLNTIFYVHLSVAQVSHVSQLLVRQGGGAVLVW